MATAMMRDVAAAAPASSSPITSTAAQLNTPSNTADQQQTTYLCTLHGLIPNPPPSAANAADPSAPTLSNLFAVLSSITPRHSAHLEDYSQHDMVNNYALYQPSSLTLNSQPPPNADRPLHSRLTALAALLNANHTDARIFCHYERVYIPTASTSNQSQLPLRLTRPAIHHSPPLPTCSLHTHDHYHPPAIQHTYDLFVPFHCITSQKSFREPIPTAAAAAVVSVWMIVTV